MQLAEHVTALVYRTTHHTAASMGKQHKREVHERVCVCVSVQANGVAWR